MILKTLHIRNFRQIAGEYTLSLSPPGTRNVTVVIGENGSGKSTLLNAFRWCLYGSVDMENPDEILSHYAVYQADIGDRVDVEVRLQFEHDGTDYCILRIRQYEKMEGGAVAPVGEEVFRGTRIAPNGETKTIGDPIGFVGNLLPENLAKFFFFQGESILQMALQRSRDELREGVETFLDFRVLDRAISHLKAIEKEFGQDLKAIASDEVVKIQEKIDELVEEIDTLKNRKAEVEKNIAANLTDTELKKQRLSEVAQFRPLLQEITKQETLLVELEHQKKEAVANLCALLSDRGYLAFSQKILDQPVALANAAVQKGELPAKIKPQFVADLLASDKCICGRVWDIDSRRTLEEWRNATGLAELEEAISDLRNKIFIYTNERRKEFVEGLPAQRERIAAITDQIREALEKKSRAEREISNVSLDEEEIKELQAAYDKLKNDLVALKVQEALLGDQIQRKNEDRDKLDKERAALAKSQEKEQVISRRIDAAKNIRKALEQVRSDWSQFVQGYLDEQLKTAWAQVAQLPRRVSFNSDFTLSIEERGGNGEWVTSAPSEANCAVLALTFVSALIRFANEVGQDKDRKDVFSGGEFPLVMDAPFAKMDEDFKRKVPTGLAGNVPQILLISNLDQWRGDVADGLQSRVGKAYVLSLHKPGEEGSRRMVKAFGKDVDYVITDEEGPMDWTEIKEVMP
jgi:DNA sulfur modification protein DndD